MPLNLPCWSSHLLLRMVFCKKSLALKVDDLALNQLSMPQNRGEKRRDKPRIEKEGEKGRRECLHPLVWGATPPTTTALNNNPLVALRSSSGRLYSSLTKTFFFFSCFLSNLASSIPNLVARLISSFSLSILKSKVLRTQLFVGA